MQWRTEQSLNMLTPRARAQAATAGVLGPQKRHLLLHEWFLVDQLTCPRSGSLCPLLLLGICLTHTLITFRLVHCLSDGWANDDGISLF